VPQEQLEDLVRKFGIEGSRKGPVGASSWHGYGGSRILLSFFGYNPAMVTSDLRRLNERVRSRLRLSRSDARAVEVCRAELAALAPQVTDALEAEFDRLMEASKPTAA
jgi:hypothetical protein